MRPYGVNVFAPPAGPGEDVTDYAARLAADGPVGEARMDDDDWDAKLELLRASPPDVVSFTFGLPGADVIAGLRERGRRRCG